MTKDKIKVGVMARARKNPDFLVYSKDTDTKIKLATEVHNKRKLMSLTQQGLAKKIKTTQKVISNIESANVSVGIDLLRRLVQELQIDAETLGKIFGVIPAWPVYKGIVMKMEEEIDKEVPTMSVVTQDEFNIKNLTY